MKASVMFYYQLLKQKVLTVLLIQVCLNLIGLSLLLLGNESRGIERGWFIPIIFTIGSVIYSATQIMKLDTSQKTKTLVSFSALGEGKKTIIKFLTLYGWVTLLIVIQGLFLLLFQLLNGTFDWQNILYLPQVLAFVCLLATMFSSYLLMPFYWMNHLIQNKRMAKLGSVALVLIVFSICLLIRTQFLTFELATDFTVFPNGYLSVSLESILWNLFFSAFAIFIDTQFKEYLLIKKR
ncbi:hypothetical protein [Isobaculum melis]|uniref:Uncharacterized protein n=1 Tax=Isobaculum melis TaxID=142588 RepID=A0A1H9SVX6_9LACT|nr:hypothetical protein [Isobaculum melis]SER89066.1 hypothetical protein SAMN04488559_10983 [Isobaculum melis]